MTEMLRILFVEDDEDDYVVTRDLLSDAYGKRFELDWTITQEAALDAMNRKKYDLCFIDYRLGGSNGLDLVREAFAQGFTAPILMLTGLDSRELDLAAMKLGVSDYLVKSELTAPLLERAIRYALARKKVEQDLAFQARYDVLTGLANRALFRERLEQGLEQAKRMSRPLAVLLLDLDHFKDINDTLGHPMGDRLLKQVAERLLRALRKTDTLARLGGDEFALVASLTQVEDASSLAGKIVQALEAPVYLNDHRIFVSASLGMTLFPLDGQDPDQLLHNADMALYQAKAQGRHTFCFYDPAMEARVQARKTLEAAIRLALERQEFRLHFQPKVNIYSGEVMGIEALLRWQHPERGEIPPLEFLPLAESTGLMVRLGHWVLRTVCRQSVAWRQAGLPPLPIGVNVSSIEFRRSDLVETIRAVVQETAMDPACLELEISEDTLTDEAGALVRALQRLRHLGLRIAIDNFGTGRSSLALLKQLPIDTLKIDRLFLRHIPADSADASITQAMIALGKSLHWEVITEGVETQAQLHFLQQHGGENAQGRYFCPPLSAEQFTLWYQNHRFDRGDHRLHSVLSK